LIARHLRIQPGLAMAQFDPSRMKNPLDLNENASRVRGCLIF
jgi:hypothetical protein